MTRHNKGLLFLLFGLVALGSVALTSSTVFAQKRGKVLRLNVIKIEGRIQKPQAFYVLNRAPLNYRSLDRKESFIRKVISAVKRKPF